VTNQTSSVATEQPETPDEQQDDQEIIDSAVAFLAFCNGAENDNRAAQLDDLAFLAGDQWDPKAKRNRELDGRPCLTINKLPTFLHQVTNDQRQNVCSIKVSPVDSGADPETAEVLQGLIRHIEYSSNADIAYDTAVNSAAQIGVGYFRLVTEYCKADSFDQDIRFKRIRNPFTVYFDPASEEPDGSDARMVMISSRMAKKDFERLYPGAEATTEQLPTGIVGLDNWIWEDFVRVAEFYRIEYEEDTLIELTNGETGYKSELIELPDNVTIARERPTQRKRVMHYTLTALEILDRTEIKCDWIPVFPIYGDELDIDGKIIRSGLIRHAKDPARMYNYWMTSATEEVALRTKTPFIGAEGQFEGYEEEWGQANVRSLPYLEYKPTTVGEQLAPPPQRQPMTDVPVGVLRMAEHANDNIKATTGLFDSSLGARGNATSGVQERAQQRQGDLANFHYTDNRNRSVRQAGRCVLSMFPNYYDAPRSVRIMGEDGSMSFAEINKPQKNPQTGAIEKILNDLSVGQYDVTISAGPSYDTLRQEAVESMVTVASKWPKLMDVAGDKVIRNMDWPGADEIADRVAKTIPQELRDEGDTQQPMVNTPRGPIPLEQAGQMLAEMDAQMQEMGAQLQEASNGIAKAKIDAGSREKVAEINAVAKNDVEELKAMVQLLIAQMPPPPVLVDKALTTGENASAERPGPSIPPEQASGPQAAPPLQSPPIPGAQ
jgi:hypothetical protein